MNNLRNKYKINGLTQKEVIEKINKTTASEALAQWRLSAKLNFCAY